MSSLTTTAGNQPSGNPRPPGQVTAPQAVLAKLPTDTTELLQNIFVELRRLNDYNDETRTVGRTFAYEFTITGGTTLQVTQSSGFALQGLVPSLNVAARRMITIDFVSAAYLNYPNPTSTQWSTLSFPYRPFYVLQITNNGPGAIRFGTSLDPNYRSAEVLVTSGNAVKVGPYTVPSVRVINIINVDPTNQDANMQLIGGI